MKGALIAKNIDMGGNAGAIGHLLIRVDCPLPSTTAQLVACQLPTGA